MSEKLIACKSCIRIENNFQELRLKYPTYYNLPVGGRGNLSARVCIVGLAPGLHGANKTGQTFTGDYCSEILFQCLRKASLYDNETPKFYITNALKCLPPNNKPNISELNNCLKYLKNDIISLSNLSVIVALGLHAHNSVLKCYDMKMTKFKFSHGAIHKLDGITLFDSYHCSKININNKRLTKLALVEVLSAALEYSEYD